MAKGQFKKGCAPGPGRPPGSRNRLETDFLEKLYADWKEHGAAAIATTRKEEPATYVKIVAQLLPKEGRVDIAHRIIESVSDEQARLMAEALIDSAREGVGVREKESRRVHDSVSSGLPGGKSPSQDC